MYSDLKVITYMGGLDTKRIIENEVCIKHATENIIGHVANIYIHGKKTL